MMTAMLLLGRLSLVLVNYKSMILVAQSIMR